MFGLSRRTVLLSLALFIFTLLIYAITVPNSNPGFADSDEFLTVAKVIGVPHPPGYPLYTLLAILISRLPLFFFSFAGRINFLSSIFHALTILCIFLTGIILLKRHASHNKDQNIIIISSTIGVLSLAVAFSFWLKAIITEVFALHSLFVAFILFLVVLWSHVFRDQKEKAQKILFISAFIAGLALSHHQIILLMFPVYAVWVLIHDVKIFLDKKFITISIISFLIGFALPYVYVPFAAYRNPTINWEHADNVKGLFRLVSRKVYAERQLGGTAYINTQFDIFASLKGIIPFVQYLFSNFGIASFFLGIIGAISLIIRKQYKIFILILLGIVGGGLFFAMYVPVPPEQIYDATYFGFVSVHQRFLIGSLMFYSLFISFGVYALYIFGKRVNKNFAVGIVALLFSIPLITGFIHYQDIKKNAFTYYHDFAKMVLESLEPNALYICFGDQACFGTLYLQEVEGVRPDVFIVPGDFTIRTRKNLLSKNKGLFLTQEDNPLYMFKDVVSLNIEKRPIYVLGFSPEATLLDVHSLTGNPFFLNPRGCGISQITKKPLLLKQSEACKNFTKKVDSYTAAEKAIFGKSYRAFFALRNLFSGVVYLNQRCFTQAQQEFASAQMYYPSYKNAQIMQKQIPKKIDNSLCPFGKIVPAEKYAEVAAKYLEKNDFERTIYAVNQAKLLDPKNIQYRLTLADVYLRINALRNAEIEYKDILVLDSKNKIARERLAQIEELRSKGVEPTVMLKKYFKLQDESPR